MSTEAPTAADKAEARRLKILAKKNARMAYAAGDRSKLPSTAPSEPVTLQPTSPAGPETARETVRDTVSAQDASATATPLRSEHSVHADLISPNLDTAAYSRPTRGAYGKAVSPIVSRWIRFVFVAGSAVLFAVVMYAGMLPLWKFSAMQVFATVEMCVFAPQLLRSMTRRGIAVNEPMSGLLGAVMSVTRYASVASHVFRDFSVFMLGFLCTWYVCTYG